MDDKIKAALEVSFDSGAGKNLTVRQYLHELLSTLWAEQEGFSGKRPFGNSGWESDLYRPLIRAGHLEGALDEDGYIERIDRQQAWLFVQKLIDAAMGVES